MYSKVVWVFCLWVVVNFTPLSCHNCCEKVKTIKNIFCLTFFLYKIILIFNFCSKQGLHFLLNGVRFYTYCGYIWLKIKIVMTKRILQGSLLPQYLFVLQDSFLLTFFSSLFKSACNF